MFYLHISKIKSITNVYWLNISIPLFYIDVFTSANICINFSSDRQTTTLIFILNGQNLTQLSLTSKQSHPICSQVKKKNSPNFFPGEKGQSNHFHTEK